MMTYTFLDPVIAMGYKVSHLPANQLPLLNDRDGAKYQTAWAFKVCCWLVGEIFAFLMQIHSISMCSVERNGVPCFST